MTDGIREYIISIIAASVVCAICKGITSKSASSKIVHILCGIFLLFTFLGPLKKIDLLDMTGVFRWNESISTDAVQRGEALTHSAMAEIISAEIASYVLERADALGAEVRIQVVLNDEDIPAPVGIELEGQVSPYVRSQLEAFIQENIGLGREAIRWIGLQ